jgi:hypothetical protein
MSAFDFDFDETAPLPSGNLDPLPKGKYLAEVVESSWEEHERAGKQSNGRDGRRVNLTFKVLEGEFEGRLFWDRLDIDRESVSNKTGETLKIDYIRFNALVGASEIGRLQDTTQLHGIPVLASLMLDPASGEYKAKNRVTAYHSAAQAAAAPAPRPQAQAQPTRPTGTGSGGKPALPWKRAG